MTAPHSRDTPVDRDTARSLDTAAAAAVYRPDPAAQLRAGEST